MANRCVFLWHRHQIGMSHDTSNRRWQSIWTARPIFGGKVVIQAKRYKNTVGVSAVRDLFGTMQNEGASKGILVTTSGYGKASFEFAQNKPLELLSGSNLLYLLEEHAGITAKIEPPEDWAQPEEKSAGSRRRAGLRGQRACRWRGCLTRSWSSRPSGGTFTAKYKLEILAEGGCVFGAGGGRCVVAS